MLTSVTSIGNVFTTLKMNAQMILLSSMVFIGFPAYTPASVYTVSEVKVGGRLYVAFWFQRGWFTSERCN